VEFLVYGIWPLSGGWEFEVEKTELPLLNITVPMPKVTAIIAEQEMEASFDARIASATNQSVGNYNSTQHRTGMSQLRLHQPRF
jgi:hypothetical protein